MNKQSIRERRYEENESDVRTSGRFRAKYRYLVDMGYSVKVNDNGSKAEVKIPGPSYEAFDTDGNCTIWSLMRLMAAARYFAYHYPLDDRGQTFMDYGVMTDSIFTFMASSELEIEKAMYDVDVPKWPLVVQARLGYIGKCSTNTVSKLIVPSTGQLLVKNVNQIVGIDKDTRKPTPLPAWWKERFGHLAVKKEPLIVPKKPKPDTAHRMTRCVMYTETDMYKHVNWTSYVVYSVDALHYGIREGLLKGFDKDIVGNGIKKMQMAYFGECVEGDMLEVYFWKDEHQPLTICVDIKKDEATVFQNTLEYYDF